MTDFAESLPKDAPAEGAVAFFPWMCVATPVEIGEFRLVPWTRRSSAEIVDRVLGTYEVATSQPVACATLVSYNGDFFGGWTNDAYRRFLEMRDLISFSALARRRFFVHAPEYVNDHTFTCALHRFDESRGLVEQSRRRDGRTLHYVPFEHRRAMLPLHVASLRRARLDQGLVAALCAAWTDATAYEFLRDAVAFFDMASTDAPDLRDHVELVLMVGAAQRAMGLENETSAEKLAHEFAKRIANDRLPGGQVPHDLARREAGTRANEMRTTTSWFKQLYRTRGSVAHGRREPRSPSDWTPAQHLLLAAYIVPRLILTRLEESGHYALSDEERDEIAAFEELLRLDDVLAAEPDDRGMRQYAWDRSLDAALERRRFARAVEQLKTEGQ